MNNFEKRLFEMHVTGMGSNAHAIIFSELKKVDHFLTTDFIKNATDRLDLIVYLMKNDMKSQHPTFQNEGVMIKVIEKALDYFHHANFTKGHEIIKNLLKKEFKF